MVKEQKVKKDKEWSFENYRPRKIPRQKRSQILFNRILMTAKDLFEKEGYAYVSTNQIADAANISIGSVYQYFANCESIALALYEEASARATIEMKRRAYQILSVPLEESMIELFSAVYNIFNEDQFVLLRLIDEVPELREAAQAVSFDNLINHAAEAYLELHYPDEEKAIITQKAYMVDKSVMGAIRGYLEDPPDYLSPQDLIAELGVMIKFYLSTLGKVE